MSFSSLKSQSASIESSSSDPNTRKLAAIVKDLCSELEKLENKVEDAHKKAKRAKRRASA